jgi:hypothetical protein
VSLCPFPFIYSGRLGFTMIHIAPFSLSIPVSKYDEETKRGREKDRRCISRF